MEIIRKYKAIDGKEFDDQDKCLDYEDLIRRVDNIMADLPSPPKDDGCRFSNGHGFVQHDPVSHMAARERFLDLVAETVNVPEEVIVSGKIHPRGIVGRYIDDSGNMPFWRAWNRFMNTDEDFREWGQAYYAINPHKGDQVCLNRESGK